MSDPQYRKSPNDAMTALTQSVLAVIILDIIVLAIFYLLGWPIIPGGLFAVFVIQQLALIISLQRNIVRKTDCYYGWDCRGIGQSISAMIKIWLLILIILPVPERILSEYVNFDQTIFLIIHGSIAILILTVSLMFNFER
jgi:hypothetical protein